MKSNNQKHSVCGSRRRRRHRRSGRQFPTLLSSRARNGEWNTAQNLFPHERCTVRMDFPFDASRKWIIREWIGKQKLETARKLKTKVRKMYYEEKRNTELLDAPMSVRRIVRGISLLAIAENRSSKPLDIVVPLNPTWWMAAMKWTNRTFRHVNGKWFCMSSLDGQKSPSFIIDIVQLSLPTLLALIQIQL